MNDFIVSTRLLVSGVRTPSEVNQALQSMYDVFTELGLGQATFEVTDSGPARLWVKHLASVSVDVKALNTALAEAGEFRIISDE